MIDVSPYQLKIIQQILRKHVPDCVARVFGSRVTWTAKDYSDLDLAIVGKERIPPKVLSALKESFEESELPYRVDVLDWNAVSAEFRKNIEKQYEVIQKGAGKKTARPDGIPEGWEASLLSEAVEVNPQRRLKKNSLVKFVSMSDLEEYGKKIQKYVVRKYSGGARFQNGDTLLARITPCLENGKTAFVDIFDNSEVAAGSTEFLVLSAKEEKTIDQFVYYLAISPQVRELAIKSMTGTSGRQRVETDIFKNITIALPRITDQRAIAKILSDLDAKIELNHQMNQTLEHIAQAIFKRWFVDFEFQGWEKTKFVNGVPEGWKIEKLGNLVDTVSVTHKLKKDKIIFLNTSDIFNGEVLHHNHSEVSALPGQAKKSIRINDILYSEIRPENKRFAFVDFDADDYVVSTKLMVLRTKSIVNPLVIYYFLKNEATINELQILAESRSGTFPQITFDHIRNLEMILPEKDILDLYTSMLTSFFMKIRQNSREIQNLIQIRDSLLPRLMSGKIRVG